MEPEQIMVLMVVQTPAVVAGAVDLIQMAVAALAAPASLSLHTQRLAAVYCPSKAPANGLAQQV
jgi:hypothetical protein